MLIESFLNVFGSIWWLVALAILLPLAHNTLVAWRQEVFKSNVKHVLMEIHIPREVRKNPKAMEQILTQIHSLGNYPGGSKSYNIDGEITLWFSLEIVSFGGETHFYIRIPEKYQDILETAFFSYYPDLEITVVDDYLNKIPKTIVELYEKDYDLWGTEIILGKDDIYPLKTYEDFESSAEKKEFDPISVLLEVLGKFKKGEFVSLQFICSPSLPMEWKKKGEALLKELREKNSVKEESGEIKSTPFTPGELELIKLVEKSIERPVFKTLIRLFYLSPKNIFNEGFIRRGIRGALNQYSSLNLNYFTTNGAKEPSASIWKWPHLFPKKRIFYRKQRILYNLFHPQLPPETFMGKVASSHLFNWNFSSKTFYLNTQTLATLFHPPMYYVLTTPHVKKIPSRKMSAPVGLPIFTDEEGLEKFEING